MRLPVYSVTGEVVSEIEASNHVFAVPFNAAVVHQALVRQRANSRRGTASTKTRGDVAYSTRKLFRQKHTGNARAGSRRSPLRRGGGIVFGPQPRSYRQAIPKKMRRLALRCLLSAKAGDGELKVVEQMELSQSKTREMVNILEALEAGSSALIVTDEPNSDVVKSAQNLMGIKTTPADLINVVDLLSYRRLVMTVDAVRRVEQLWGQEVPRGKVNASV
jgi:large subunit ribosomal protein L4